jgi:hypothetical protein
LTVPHFFKEQNKKNRTETAFSATSILISIINFYFTIFLSLFYWGKSKKERKKERKGAGIKKE